MPTTSPTDARPLGTRPVGNRAGKTGPVAANQDDPISVPQKLGFKPGMVCSVLDVPNGFRHGLPATSAAEPELILAFATDRASLGRVAARALDLYGVGGRLWFAYPKKGGPIRSDLDRDHGWEPLTQAGLLPVTQVALDGTWSALRFRLREEVPTLTRKGG